MSETFNCPECNHLFQPGEDRDRKMDDLVTHWGDGPKKYLCRSCGHTFYIKEFVVRTYCVATSLEELESMYVE